MAHFEALHLALELAGTLSPLLSKLEHRDPDLLRQIRRAAASVVLNLSEGSQRTGKDRLHLYRIGAGSAAEVLTAIELAVAWRYVSTPQAESALALSRRVVAITWRLTHPRT